MLRRNKKIQNKIKGKRYKKMAGYQEFSKSNNAVEAEEGNRYPATTLAKILKVKVGGIKEYMNPCEYHHCSKFYNSVDFYDGDLLICIANGLEISGDYEEEDIAEARELLTLLREYKPSKPEPKRYIGNIEYFEWYKNRGRWAYNRIRHENIEIEEKGCFFLFHENGKPQKKKIDSNGTEVEKLRDIAT